jgi:hypothetical protein
MSLRVRLVPSLPMASGKEAWDEPLLRVPARLWSFGFNGKPNKLRPSRVWWQMNDDGIGEDLGQRT